MIEQAGPTPASTNEGAIPLDDMERRIMAAEHEIRVLSNGQARHERALFGHDEHPGLVSKVDRIEQRDVIVQQYKMSSKQTIAFWIGVVGAVGGGLLSAITAAVTFFK